MKRNTHKERLNSGAADAGTGHELAAEVEAILTPDQEQVLAAAAAELARLDRDTTAQTFERGKYFARAKAILPTKAFGKWLKAHTSYTVRHAWNHISVDEKLGWHRSRCEAASVPPTTLFILAAADEEQVVEEVLCAFERGERLTGARVKAMIALARNEPAREVEPLNVGGAKGMIRAGELRLRDEVDRFGGLVKAALGHVEAAAEKIANGKTVTKTALADAIRIDCRHAHDVLSMTVAPVVSNRFAENENWKPGQVTMDTAWSAVQSVLYRLGGDSWPDREAFPRWLTTTVRPVLRFVVHGEELPGFEAERIVHVAKETEETSGSDEPEAEAVASDSPVETEQERFLADDRVVAIETERGKRLGKQAETMAAVELA